MVLINFYFSVCSVYNVLYSRANASLVTLVPVLTVPTDSYVAVTSGLQLSTPKLRTSCQMAYRNVG